MAPPPVRLNPSRPDGGPPALLTLSSARSLCDEPPSLAAILPHAMDCCAQRPGVDGMPNIATDIEIPGVLWRRGPQAGAVPVVFDSPHSGAVYPDDFAYCCPLPVLRRAEDSYVDELYEAAPTHGATLIAALFPRSYIDANRAADDLDP